MVARWQRTVLDDQVVCLRRSSRAVGLSTGDLGVAPVEVVDAVAIAAASPVLETIERLLTSTQKLDRPDALQAADYRLRLQGYGIGREDRTDEHLASTDA